MRFSRGISTIETMVMMLLVSIVVLATFAARQSSLWTYREMVSRERALLYATETLEQIEAIKLTRVQQNYQRSWRNFLGDREDGFYQLVMGEQLSDLNLLLLSHDYQVSDDDEMMIRYYDEDDGSDGFFTRLERRIFLESISEDQKKVTVSVFWGVPGSYQEEARQQVRLQALFTDQVQPAFVL